LKITTNNAPMQNKPTRAKSRTITLSAETALAVDEMFKWMRENCMVDAWDMPSSRRRDLNLKIQAMCQAVVNYDPPCDGAFYFPLVFEARNETRDEQEQRVMLQRLSAGEPTSHLKGV